MSRAFQHVTLAPAVTSNGHVHKGRKSSVSVEDMTGETAGVTGGKASGSAKTTKNVKGSGLQVKAVDNRAYIDAIKAAYPPDKITELLAVAIDLAIQTNSWRGVVAACEFAANYSLGKPVKRVESSGDTSLADLLAGVDTSKPLLAMGYDKASSHMPVEQGQAGSAGSNDGGSSGSSGSSDVVLGENNSDDDE
jgi:hypothetical protein